MSSIFEFFGEKLNSISERFKIIRKALNMTQSEIAEKINITNASISDIERGRTKPSYDVQRYLHFNGVNLDFLFTGIGTPLLSNHEKIAESYAQIEQIGPEKIRERYDAAGFDMAREMGAVLDRRVMAIPLVASVAAGPGLLDQDNTVQTLYYPEDAFRGLDKSRLFAVMVQGDSMEPYFFTKDIIISSVDFPFTVQDSGRFAIAHLPDHHGDLIKKVVYTPEGLEFHSMNTEYSTIRLDRQASHEVIAYRILRMERVFY